MNYCVGGADLESGFTRVDGGLSAAGFSLFSSFTVRFTTQIVANLRCISSYIVSLQPPKRCFETRRFSAGLTRKSEEHSEKLHSSNLALYVHTLRALPVSPRVRNRDYSVSFDDYYM